MNQDIFALLAGNQLPDPSQAALPVLSLWRATTYYLMFFTLHPAKIASHYDDDAGSYLCLEEGCPACAASLKATEHVYLPVWDAQNRQIAVLKFDTRPDGPAAKILAFLGTYKNQLADVVAVVVCKGKGEFNITAHQPLPETDRGALACQAFCKGLEAGTVNLRGCLKNLAKEEISKLALVKRTATPVVGAMVAPASAAPAPAVTERPGTPKKRRKGV